MTYMLVHDTNTCVGVVTLDTLHMCCVHNIQTNHHNVDTTSYKLIQPCRKRKNAVFDHSVEKSLAKT